MTTNPGVSKIPLSWSILWMGKLRHAEVKEFSEDHQPGSGGAWICPSQLALESELLITRLYHLPPSPLRGML